MEKVMVKAYDMECMKMALLKHEETFKQQVYELHRLYEIQRVLMKNMQISMQNTSLINGNIYDQKHHFQKQDHGDHEDDDDDDGGDEMEDESEIELTLGPTTSYSRKKKKKLYLESSAGLEMFPSSSSLSSTHKTRLITLQNSGVLI
ncbi:hypothetical protein OSB04_027248 [Centaurea solstitialis]|uniref:Uncharacterized protein n=1 Tax=Centaurea solstitialis TaxID=347529 RepID=A0AA38VWH3_9ASTR|nr:hypothetical protein OSB04_027248 [Centaurea solstitialis]